MQVHCTDDPEQANYHVRDNAAKHGMSGAEVGEIYPKPSLDLTFRQNMSYVELNPVACHVFPGFDIEVPKLDISNVIGVDRMPVLRFARARIRIDFS